MLERVHRRILRTIQGLPLRCHSKALLHLMGFSSITSLIQQRQLNFVRSFASLPADSLPRLVLEKRFSGSPMKGSLPIFCTLFESLDLPSLPSIIEGSWSRKAWRRWVGNLCRSTEYSSFLDECSHLHLSDCMLDVLHVSSGEACAPLDCYSGPAESDKDQQFPYPSSRGV